MKVLGAQNTSYLATQTIPFWERKYVVWYICLLSPAGRPARIASLLWHVVKFSPRTQSQTKARDTRTSRGFHCLWSENSFRRENIAEVNKKWTFGRSLRSSGSQAKNPNAPSSHRFIPPWRRRALQRVHGVTDTWDPKEAHRLAAPSTETRRSTFTSPEQTEQPTSSLKRTSPHLPRRDWCCRPYRMPAMRGMPGC